MKKHYLLLTAAGLLSMAANAQRYLGIATGNWSGTTNMYLNPANIADSRSKFYDRPVLHQRICRQRHGPAQQG